ncbi:MAG: putative metal-binding motif-containing protein [Myxococcota bacterium]
MHRVLVASALALLAGCGDAAPMGGGDGAIPSCRSDADCDDGLFCTGPERCNPASTSANPLGCVAGAPPCSLACNEAMETCLDTGCPDADGDGVTDFRCGGADCDDADASRFPGATEVCDAEGIDEDCDPTTLGDLDADEDGVVSAACCNVDAAGRLACGRDCDDSAPGVSPVVPDVCNAIDDDCDGLIDEGVQVPLYPDGDGDGVGVGDAASFGCAGAPGFGTRTGDCDDAAPSVFPGAPETCNGIDDDCDSLVDDLIDGVVVCPAGTTRPCLTACGLAGTQDCVACESFDVCATEAEVCNGCDDDANGAVDDVFECEFGTAPTCTTACGTAGSQLCSAECALGVCRAPEELCNYCDDDGDGTFDEERSLPLGASAPLLDCPPATGLSGAATCTGVLRPGNELWFELLDGTSPDQSGAVWFDLPMLNAGWGATRFEVELRVEARPDGGTDFETALGEWELLLGSGGGPTGTPTTGIQTIWFWNSQHACGTPGRPPWPVDDEVGYRALSGGIALFREPELSGGLVELQRACQRGIGTTRDLDGGAGVVVQRMSVTYTPDDPLTASDEERVVVEASGAVTQTFGPGLRGLRPDDDLPVGTGPLRLGVRATSRSETGFTGPPAGWRMGVPIHAEGRIWRMSMPDPMGPPVFEESTSLSLDGICP